MKSRDWQQVENLYHTAFDLPVTERAAYLVEACGGDDSLRREVESLLAASDKSPEFLERSVFSLGLAALARGSAEVSLVGQTVGSYRMLRLLGRGGMGNVYLAEDFNLKRHVALKFISHRLVDDAWAKRQFVKEAQAAANLDHPNICTIHGFEEDNGHSFIVMQYIEGQTLADLTRQPPPALDQVLDIATQVTEALCEAHTHGIIHRDVKPQNIMVMPTGQVKVLDFGLAKIVQQGEESFGAGDSQASLRGRMIGTVSYMSPEQLRAERPDFRTDIFSLGIVLYELVSGENPFTRASEADTISAILTSSPTPPTRPSARIPPELSQLILKTLEKDKERRYQSASELLYDLNDLRDGIESGTRRRWFQARHRAAALLLCALLLIIATYLYQSLVKRPYTLAVLPVLDESADTRVARLSEGLADNIGGSLSRVPGLRVSAPMAAAGYRDRQINPRKIGRDLDVDAVLLGTITRQSDGLVLQAALVETADGSQLWRERYAINANDLSQLREEIPEKIAANLELWLVGSKKPLQAGLNVDKEEALRDYLRGRRYWRSRNKENILQAIESFNAAIEVDPAYARAYAGLADCYVLLNTVAYGHLPTKEAMTKARWAARQALEIDEGLPEAHTSLAVVSLKYDWNWSETERELRRAISLKPDYAPAHYWYSHLLVITGRGEEALAESELAKDLDPFSSSARFNYCRAFYNIRRYDEAEACLNGMLGEDPDNVNVRYVLGLVYQQKGMSAEAIQIFRRLYEKDKSLGLAPLGYAYGRAGMRDDALKLLAEAEELSKHVYLPPLERGIIYAGLDEHDQAFAWLERAFEERFASVTYLTVDPIFDGLRSDPRFHDLARRLNLPPS